MKSILQLWTICYVCFPLFMAPCKTVCCFLFISHCPSCFGFQATTSNNICTDTYIPQGVKATHFSAFCQVVVFWVKKTERHDVFLHFQWAIWQFWGIIAWEFMKNAILFPILPYCNYSFFWNTGAVLFRRINVLNWLCNNAKTNRVLPMLLH